MHDIKLKFNIESANIQILKFLVAYKLNVMNIEIRR